MSGLDLTDAELALLRWTIGADRKDRPLAWRNHVLADDHATSRLCHGLVDSGLMTVARLGSFKATQTAIDTIARLDGRTPPSPA